jgi:hypothetical protein
VHARKNADAVALCGAEPGLGKWSNKRSAITCTGCCVVADQRIKAREDVRAKKWRR